MAIYEAYLSPLTNEQGSATQFESLQSFKLVEDKKHILALIFPAIWLLWNKLWFWFAVYILASILIVLLSTTQLAVIGTVVSIAFGLFLFLEGRTLIVSKLERQGWRFKGVVDAPDVEFAEYKFLESQNIDAFRQENSNLSIDSSVEPIISVDEKSSLSNQTAKSPINSKMGDRPSIGIFSEG